MAISVIMPALGMAQETGKLVAWRKKDGDAVVKGEPLLEIETDKVIVELEAPGDGVLASIRVQDGAEVPVGQTIAWIVSPGETPPGETPVAESAGPPMVETIGRPPSAPVITEPAGLKISPKARRLARERGIDLANVRGSGAGGEILASDVLAAQPAAVESQPAVEPLSTIARLMAVRTTQSWTSVPHFFVVRETEAESLLREREAHGSGVTVTDILIALVARMLVRHPRLNASWIGEGIRSNAAVNIALAVAVSEGVVAPVIHDAHKKALSDIAAQPGTSHGNYISH